MGEARDAVERFYELFAAGKITDAAEVFDPSCITLMPGGALTQPEHEGVRRPGVDYGVDPARRRRGALSRRGAPSPNSQPFFFDVARARRAGAVR